MVQGTQPPHLLTNCVGTRCSHCLGLGSPPIKFKESLASNDGSIGEKSRLHSLTRWIARLPVPTGWRMLIKFVSELVYSGLSWGKERCCKSGVEHGAICAVLVRIADRWGRSR